MALKISNVNNRRKTQLWNEQDDIQLAILLKRKVKDTAIAIRESTTPYERSRLKTQRARYKTMLKKVETGSYNGDIIFNELQASAALRQEAQFSSGLYSSMAGGRRYTNTYGAVDFDFESAFRKKRYYGIALPLLLTLLTLIMIASVVIGAFCPSLIPQNIADKIKSATTIDLNALIVYRLGETEGDDFDIGIKADDNGYWWWPEGTYEEEPPAPGEPYVDEKGVVHDGEGEIVYLYQDLGCYEIYIDAVDIIKAWFKTKMLESTRLDFLEDLSIFQGPSYYYTLFLSGSKADDLVIKKNEDGNYDFGVIYNHIGVYGTIMFLLATLVLMVIMLLQNLIRIFTYTSRRVNAINVLCLIFGILTMIAPVFATSVGTEVGASFTSYFQRLTSPNTFLDNISATAGISLMLLIPLALCFLITILPKFFKNRHRTIPTHIPKGNKRAHIK